MRNKVLVWGGISFFILLCFRTRLNVKELEDVHQLPSLNLLWEVMAVKTTTIFLSSMDTMFKSKLNMLKAHLELLEGNMIVRTSENVILI